MQEKLDKQHKNKKSFDWLKAYQWQKGQSGNPDGRPKTKTMKEFAREFLSQMSDEDRIAYFESVHPYDVWQMAEGKAKQDTEIKGNLTISQVLDELENGHETERQELED